MIGIRRETVFKIVTVVLSIVLTVAALETYFTIKYHRWFAKARSKILYAELKTRPSADPILIYELNPKNPENNSAGFRDRPFTAHAAPGWVRIALIGDSVVMGAGVERDEAFSAVLNRMFGKAGEKIEVYNFGVTGYNTVQEFEVLKTRAMEFHPDFILWNYHLNDPADAVQDNANGNLGKYYYHPTSFLWFSITRNFYFKRKQFYTLIHGMGDADWHETIHFWKRNEIERDLGNIRDWLSERSIPWMVVLIPVWPQRGDTFDPYYLIRPWNDTRALLEELNIPYVDTFEFFGKREPTQYQIDIDDEWHPNPKGHAAIAEYIYQPLLDAVKKGTAKKSS